MVTVHVYLETIISDVRGQLGARCDSSESTMSGYSFVSFDNVVNRLWPACLKALHCSPETSRPSSIGGRTEKVSTLSRTASMNSPCICGHLICAYEGITFRQTIHLTYIC